MPGAALQQGAELLLDERVPHSIAWPDMHHLWQVSPGGCWGPCSCCHTLGGSDLEPVLTRSQHMAPGMACHGMLVLIQQQHCHTRCQATSAVLCHILAPPARQLVYCHCCCSRLKLRGACAGDDGRRSLARAQAAGRRGLHAAGQGTLAGEVPRGAARQRAGAQALGTAGDAEEGTGCSGTSSTLLLVRRLQRMLEGSRSSMLAAAARPLAPCRCWLCVLCLSGIQSPVAGQCMLLIMGQQEAAARGTARYCA